MTTRPQPDARDAYPRFVSLTTRWMDNDAYGHLNNVVYYSLFDTAVNSLLIEAGALDIHGGEVIGLVVETHCNFFESLAFPQRIEAGQPLPPDTDSVAPFDAIKVANGNAEALVTINPGDGVLPAGGDSDPAIPLRRAGE
eukprot:gene7364-9121_t